MQTQQHQVSEVILQYAFENSKAQNDNNIIWFDEIMFNKLFSKIIGMII